MMTELQTALMTIEKRIVNFLHATSCSLVQEGDNAWPLEQACGEVSAL